MTKSSLENYVDEIREAWGPLSSETVANCQRLLEELVKRSLEETWLTGLLDNPGMEKELYRDAEHGFVLSAYIEKKGRYRVPHDHGSGWVIYAIQSGQMEMGTYCRTVTRKGQMRLVRRESFRMHPGDCGVFLPGDIHDTRAISSSVVIFRFTSCDLKKEDREGRMIRYPEQNAGSSLE